MAPGIGTLLIAEAKAPDPGLLGRRGATGSNKLGSPALREAPAGGCVLDRRAGSPPAIKTTGSI
ncbi:protein of unknown function [Methylacidimicrobium sp. AP8]|nr:protein of unknown function [Methylacidimicrobium sp. AP8]